MSPNGSVVVKVNRSDDTISFINPQTGAVTDTVDVGLDPVGVAVSNDFAYVANFDSRNISVVSLTSKAVVDTIGLDGGAPRGLLLSDPPGTLYVIAGGGMWVVDTADNSAGFFNTGGGGAMVMDDALQKIYVNFASQVLPGRTSLEEGQDDQRVGRVVVLSATTLAQFNDIIFSPVNNTGFGSNGKSAPAMAFNSPPTPAVASTNPPNANTPTGAFPNLLAAGARHPLNGLIYVASTGSSPNGPASPSTNHHGIVSVFDPNSGQEVVATQQDPNVVRTAPLPLNRNVNLANPPVPFFISNPVAMAWEPDGSNGWIVNQNTNCLVRVSVDAQGVPTVGAPLVAGPSSIVMLDLASVTAPLIAGKAPDGIVINAAGTRAFISNAVSRSVTTVDITDPAAPFVVATAQSAALPQAGSNAAQVLRGEELFHSARGRMSSQGWSSCSSCHPGGSSDNVTWMFADGPRQTPSLAGVFSKSNSADQRILNWSATFDELADFERNTRGTHGGQGLIDDDRKIAVVGGAGSGGDLQGWEEIDQWTRTIGANNSRAGGAPFPTVSPRRDDASVTLPDGRMYRFGGRTGAGQGTLVTGQDLVYKIDVPNNTASPCNGAGLTPRYSCGAAAVTTPQGPRIYVAGGYTDTSGTSLPTDLVQEYNPDADTWRDCTPLSQAAAEFGICTAGGMNSNEPLERIHVVSGNKGSEMTPSLISSPFNVQVFTPDPAGPGTFTTFAVSGITARRHAGAAGIVKEALARVYVFGGINAAGTVLATVQEYGAQSGISFTGFTKTNMPAARARFGICTVEANSKVCIAGGIDSAGNLCNDVYEFTAAVNGPTAGGVGSPSGAWTTIGTLATARRNFAMTTPPSIAPLRPHATSMRSEDWAAIEAYLRNLKPLPAPNLPNDSAVVAGRALFQQVGLVRPGFSCASCHGGPKWTRSTVDYSAPPSANTTSGNERINTTMLQQTLTQPSNGVLVNVGTFSDARSNEVRSSPTDARLYSNAHGSFGYNIPALLDVHATAPYFHSGLAQTLEEVLDGTWDSTGGTRHHFVTSASNRANLIAFLRSIDADTTPIGVSSAAPAQVVSLSFDPMADLAQINYTGTINQVYTVERSFDLQSWRTFRSYNAGAAGTFTVQDPLDVFSFSAVLYRTTIR